MRNTFQTMLCFKCFLLLLMARVEAFRSTRFSYNSIKWKTPLNPERHVSAIQRNGKSISDAKHEVFKHASPSMLKSISLDTAVLPTNGLRVAPFSPRVSLFIIVSTIFGLILASPVEDMKGTKGLFGGKLWPFTDVLFPGVALLIRIILAKIGLLVESSVKKIASIGKQEQKDFVGRNDWSICTISERESISNRYVKYRFELDNPSSYIPVDIGQEVLRSFFSVIIIYMHV